MKELTLSVGNGRLWSGTEIITGQMENLDILQGYFSQPGQAAAITGIQVTGSAISAGLAVIKHADGWKVVRFAGATGVTFPYYLQVTKAQPTKLYDDLTYHPVQNVYTATVATPGGTPPTDVYLKVTASGAVRWEDTFGRYGSTAWESLAFGLATSVSSCSGDVKIRLCKLSNSVQIRGYVDVSVLAFSGVTSFWDTAVNSIGAQYLPAVTTSFTCGIDYEDGGGGMDKISATGGSYYQSVSARLTTAGTLEILMLRTVSSSFRVFVNETIPLG